MTQPRHLARELDALKKDIASLRQTSVELDRPHLASTIVSELGELRGLVDDMLADAEHGIAEHPVATVAGALALGILIGRITAR